MLSETSTSVNRRRPRKLGQTCHEAAALEHGSAHDGGEVVDRVEDGERLQPLGHGLDGIERARERRHRRIDEEAGELGLLRGLEKVAMTVPMLMPERMQSIPATSEQRKAAVEGNSEDEFDDADGGAHHEGKQEEERGDLGDDDLGGAGGRHEELLDGAGFALADHGRGRDEGAVEDEQEAEDSGDDEPGVDQARVEEEVGHELHLAAAGEVRR